MVKNEQTLDQKRAAHSLSKVREIQAKLSEQEADDYAGYVVRLPADILSSGLGQALAQLQAVAKQNHNDPHYLVYHHLQTWLCRNEPEAPYPGAKDLLEALMTHDRFQYQWALNEAMAWLEWHKKLAVAYLKKTAGVSE